MTNLLPATTNPLAGHSVMQMLDVTMSSIIGDYDDADLVPEWQWVKRMASHEHVGVKDATLAYCRPAGRCELHPVLQRLATATW